MLSLGLTGNFGCGKSTVARLLEELGAARIDADAIVRELLAEGGAATGPVLDAFPGAGADGRVDRTALAGIVFDDEERRRELEDILHPLVIAENRRRLAELEAAGTELAVTEATLLFEAARSGSAGEDSLSRFDAIVAVTCRPELQRARAIARGVANGLSESEAEADYERRVAAQMPQDEKAALATHVIDNSGEPDETRTLVAELHARLRDGGA